MGTGDQTNGRATVAASERQQVELLTWRLVVGVVEATGAAVIAEMHGGGGQYDEIRLFADDPQADSSDWVSINRPGRVHVSRGGVLESRALLRSMQHGLPLSDAVRWIRERFAAGPPAFELAPSTRFMSALLDRVTGLDPQAECSVGWVSLIRATGARAVMAPPFPTEPDRVPPGPDLISRPASGRNVLVPRQERRATGCDRSVRRRRLRRSLSNALALN